MLVHILSIYMYLFSCVPSMLMALIAYGKEHLFFTPNCKYQQIFNYHINFQFHHLTPSVPYIYITIPSHHHLSSNFHTQHTLTNTYITHVHTLYT